MIVWPYCPRDDLVEAVEWFTNVLRTIGSEQRICLRMEPRRTFSFRHTMNDNQIAAALNLLRGFHGGNQLAVPDWTQAIDAGPIGPGSATLQAGLCEDFGLEAMLWEDETKWEIVDCEVTSGGILIDNVSGIYTSAKLMPLWPAVSYDGLSFERIGAGMSQAEIAFTTTENSDLAFSAYAQYLGVDVLPHCPVVRSLSESFAWPVEAFDNGQSAPYLMRSRAVPDWQYTMSWTLAERCQLHELRQWIHSRKGRQKAFWHSTWSKDFLPAADVSGTTLTIFSLPGFDGIGHGSPFHLEIKTQSGNLYWCMVTAATPGATVDGESTIDLTIDPPLAILRDNIERVSYFRCSRFDSDRIEISHAAPGVATITVPCIEIPQP